MVSKKPPENKLTVDAVTQLLAGSLHINPLPFLDYIKSCANLEVCRQLVLVFDVIVTSPTPFMKF